MNNISIKTAYNHLKEFSTGGSSYPPEGALSILYLLKQLFTGRKLEQILNTWASVSQEPVNINQTLQTDMADDIEWEGPFVFVINKQNLFLNFSAPKHYEIGINSQSINDIVDISSKPVSELEKYGRHGQFVDISFLYGDKIIGQTIKDIHMVIKDKNERAFLSAVVIELQNNVCLVVSEELDNPMLRIYEDLNKAKHSLPDNEI